MLRLPGVSRVSRGGASAIWWILLKPFRPWLAHHVPWPLHATSEHAYGRGSLDTVKDVIMPPVQRRHLNAFSDVPSSGATVPRSALRHLFRGPARIASRAL